MERKLAAILAADVVAYSALMERDEAGTFERLKARRHGLFEPEIQKHHGRIFNVTGDGLLAEFASVVDSVECAVALQRGMEERNAAVSAPERFHARIGINLGEVIVDGDDRYGEGVNIAARLEQLAEPGGICVSGKVAKEVEKKLALGFEPLGEQKVKNIAEPISVYRVRLDATRPRKLALARRLPAKRWTAVSVATALLIAVGIGGAYLSNRGNMAAPARTPIVDSAPSLAVLPLTNLSGDPDLDYFASGVTENLTAVLSRSLDIRVIARTSSEAYKGKSLDVRQIGRELGAHYVLEGSVQKGGGKVRIVAQLIDATNGGHVWAERYDREGTDPLALQDQVAEQIMVTLTGGRGLIKKKEYEKAWGKDSASLDEYDYYLRGLLNYRFSKDDTDKAIGVWNEGLGKFPGSSLIKVSLGWGYYQRIYGGWSSDVPGDYKRAYDIAQEGLGSADAPPIAQAAGHALMSYLQIEYRKNWDQALRESEIFGAVNPNEPGAACIVSEIAIRAGEPEKAIANLSRDLPWDYNSIWASPHLRLGWAYFVKQDYAAALEHLKQERGSDPVWTMPFFAATYAELGMMDEAKAMTAKIREANPTVSLALIAQVFSNRDQAVTDRLVGALRKAGLPEA